MSKTVLKEDEQLKCKCGSENFRAYEDYIWDVTITEDGVHFTSPESEVTTIFCAECGEEVDEQELQREYNFN
jgi:hypothetical protein